MLSTTPSKGVLETFKIVLDNEEETYSPGDILKGYVVVKLHETIPINGIMIRFRGISNVSFESLDYYNGELRMYGASEQYFLESYNLESQGTIDEKTLAAGSHTFQFSYNLPEKLPSSFEGEHGHVRYGIKCTIYRQQALDFQTKTAFAIVKPLPLSSVPKCEVPIASTDIVTDSPCCYCDRGAIIADLSIGSRGYTPGNAIEINAKVCNSTQHLVSCQVQLCQTVLYHTPGKNKESINVVTCLKHELLDVDDSDIWDGVKLLVPQLPPTNLAGCNLIDVHYTVMLKAAAEGNSNMQVTLPLAITIGTRSRTTTLDTKQKDITDLLSPAITTQPYSVPLSTFKSNPFSTSDKNCLPQHSSSHLTHTGPPSYQEVSAAIPSPLYTTSVALCDKQNKKTSNIYNM